MCNPRKVDKLISENKMVKAKEDQTVPRFNGISIDTTYSMTNGIFIIKGTPLMI